MSEAQHSTSGLEPDDTVTSTTVSTLPTTVPTTTTTTTTAAPPTTWTSMTTDGTTIAKDLGLTIGIPVGCVVAIIIVTIIIICCCRKSCKKGNAKRMSSASDTFIMRLRQTFHRKNSSTTALPSKTDVEHPSQHGPRTTKSEQMEAGTEGNGTATAVLTDTMDTEHGPSAPDIRVVPPVPKDPIQIPNRSPTPSHDPKPPPPCKIPKKSDGYADMAQSPKTPKLSTPPPSHHVPKKKHYINEDVAVNNMKGDAAQPDHVKVSPVASRGTSKNKNLGQPVLAPQMSEDDKGTMDPDYENTKKTSGYINAAALETNDLAAGNANKCGYQNLGYVLSEQQKMAEFQSNSSTGNANSGAQQELYENTDFTRSTPNLSAKHGPAASGSNQQEDYENWSSMRNLMVK